MSHDDTKFWVTVSVVVLLTVYTGFDLLLLARLGPDATISAVVRGWGERFPMLPFIMAFAFGAFVYHVAYR